MVYEALSRILVEGLQTDEIQHERLFERISDVIKDFNSSICQDEFENLIEADVVTNFNNVYIDYLENLNQHGGDLAIFWLTFMDMTKILLNLLAATRSGNWHLFLETVRDVIPYTFAYDNINYSRYLTVMFCEMLSLESNFPDVYNEFMNGNFTAQLSRHSTFGRMEPDKVSIFLLASWLLHD